MSRRIQYEDKDKARPGELPTLGTLAIVGRPNVGKSTLFNRLVGSRRAIVGDEPGITRDRLYGDIEWAGRRLRVVDTGGIVPDDKALIPSEIFRQARVALEEADAIVMVVDGRTELASPDLELARQLLRTGKPLSLAVNKMDTPKLEPYAEEFRRLGLKELFAISAENGNGIAELLEHVISVMPKAASEPGLENRETRGTRGSASDEQQVPRLPTVARDDNPLSGRKPTVARDDNSLPGRKSSLGMTNQEGDAASDESLGLTKQTGDAAFAVAPGRAKSKRKTARDSAKAAAEENGGEGEEPTEAEQPEEKEVKVAIIGRPNVGKSTLLNALTGTGRAIVSPIAGTTRDAIDEVLERDGMSYRFIDTAGIRRKGKTELMAEKLSVVMARKHLEAADVALIVIDAVEGVTGGDATIAGYAHESGRSVIIVINKWDLVTTARTDGKPPADMKLYEEQARRHLKFLNYAPVVFVSAVKGKNLDKLFSTLELVARERRKRVGTGAMNRFLSHIDFERASVPMSKRVRILYMTQAAVSPPTFILFTDREVKLHFSYQRFLENQIRESFGFVGTPIWIKNRARNEGKK